MDERKKSIIEKEKDREVKNRMHKTTKKIGHKKKKSLRAISKSPMAIYNNASQDFPLKTAALPVSIYHNRLTFSPKGRKTGDARYASEFRRPKGDFLNS